MVLKMKYHPWVRKPSIIALRKINIKTPLSIKLDVPIGSKICTCTIWVTVMDTFNTLWNLLQKEKHATDFITIIHTWVTSVLALCASAGSILLAGTGPNRSLTDCFTTGKLGCWTKGCITCNTTPKKNPTS